MSLLAEEYMLNWIALVPHPFLPWWKVLGLDAKRGLPQAKQHLSFISYCHGHDSLLGMCFGYFSIPEPPQRHIGRVVELEVDATRLEMTLQLAAVKAARGRALEEAS